MDVNKEALFIWDMDALPPLDMQKVILWRHYHIPEEASEWISVPAFVEAHSDALKARFLAWVYELGEVKIHNKRVIEHLELREGFSYWWMTTLVEKNQIKSKLFYHAIRLLALEKLLATVDAKSIVCVGTDSSVSKSIKVLCIGLGLGFKRLNKQDVCSPRAYLKNSFFRLVPYPLQALGSLIKKSAALRLFKKEKNEPLLRHKADVLCVDFLANLNNEAIKKRQFGSYYWTALIQLFEANKIKVNWLHFYVKHDAIPTRTDAKHMIEQLNDLDEFNSHLLFAEGISGKRFMWIIRDYLRLLVKSFFLRRIKKKFTVSYSKLDFWPLFKAEWLNSVRGKVAFHHCFILNVFEALLQHMPTQKIGIYLQENLPWEVAFIYMWRKYKHGELLAVAHSTIRYWDLRYFHDARCYSQKLVNALNMPNYMLINGPVARALCVSGGYPVEKIRDVEALRYLYLNNKLPARNRHDFDSSLYVLVLGDIDASSNDRMMSCLKAVLLRDGVDIKCILKSHPVRKITVDAEIKPSVCEKTALLVDLFQQVDVVLTSNNTSAAVDAYCAGLPVIQMLDGQYFNGSPLRGLSGVIYVQDAVDLVRALQQVRERDAIVPLDYFYLDKTLPRWRELLNLNHMDCESFNV